MIATWLGIIITIISTAFAVYEYRQRTRVESVVRDTLRRLAGEMRVVFSNAKWTNDHLRTVGHLFNEASPDLTKIKNEVFDAKIPAQEDVEVYSSMQGQYSLTTMPKICDSRSRDCTARPFIPASCKSRSRQSGRRLGSP
jgi:hypothetical protein